MTTRRADCPRYRITTQAFGGGEYQVLAHALDTDKRVGHIALWSTGPHLQVMQSKVLPEHRSCGLGTKLYEAAAKLACGLGKTLASDDTRSTYSQRFWEKQVRKGRAVCVQETAPYEGPSDAPVVGRGGCDYYALTKCGNEIDLSGRRPRRRRRR